MFKLNIVAPPVAVYMYVALMINAESNSITMINCTCGLNNSKQIPLLRHISAGTGRFLHRHL